MFIGWDWASATHDVTLLDERGAVVAISTTAAAA
jgi:hypothetical protein